MASPSGSGSQILIESKAGRSPISTASGPRWVFLATIGDLFRATLCSGNRGAARQLAAADGWWCTHIGLALPFFSVRNGLRQCRLAAMQKRTSSHCGTQCAPISSLGSTPQLLRWLLLATIPTLLDELFLGFAGLFLTDIVGVLPSVLSLALLAPIVGGLLSLGLMQRFGKSITPARLLGNAALITLVDWSGLSPRRPMAGVARSLLDRVGGGALVPDC